MNIPKNCIGCEAVHYWENKDFQYYTRCTECIHFRKSLNDKDYKQYHDLYLKTI